MLVDHTTLSDLEVFGSTEGDGGLFALLDRTRTNAGRAALRRRVQEPCTTLEDVRRSQDAVRFLWHHPDVLQLREESVAPVWAYLHSNIAVSKQSATMVRAEYAWMTIRFGDVVRELRAGVDATRRLFEDVARLCQRLADLGPPEVIAEAIEELEVAAQQVFAARTASGGLLGIDRVLRGEHRSELEGSLATLAEFDAEGVLHPFISEGVANPARVTGGEPMVFLTGPNMAGKTTYLKSVALIVLLAQTGMGVPAERMRFTPVEALFTSLNPGDNLRAGLSYFLAEIMRVKAAATLLAEGRRALILFDEVFKGTNVGDALDASAEVILGFAKASRSGFMFSSHLVELVDVLAESPAIRFCCFDGDIVDGTPHYGYRLREGVSDKRFGLLLLTQARVPELLARISA